jgi:hypothetical protein
VFLLVIGIAALVVCDHVASGRAIVVREAEARESTAPAVQGVDWKAVDKAIGRAGAAQPGDVYRFSFPRGDLRVMVGDVQVKPALALGGWVAMKATSGGVVAMGDLVLTEDELTPVITKLQSGGVEQTAIHHHIMRESPRVLYTHIHAHGDAIKIAETIRAAVALTKTPAAAPPAAPMGELGIDTAQVARALGYGGRVNGGVYQVSVPRAETIRDGSFEVPASMGLATALNFQPTGGGKAAITGDFVLRASEANPVIRMLRENGIEVTSLHSHLLSEEPRLFFMHFWANDDAVKLARGLRQALDQTTSRRPTT